MEDMKIFHGLKKETLDFIENSIQKREYKSGEVICLEGEAADELYFINKGRVCVSSKKKKIAFLEKGEEFGEMSLIDMMKRATDVIAVENTTVFVLHKKYMYEIYKENLKEYVIILINLARELSRRLREMNKFIVDLEE